MPVHRFQNEATMWEWPAELDTQCMLGNVVSCNTAFCMLEMRNDCPGFVHAQLQCTAAGGVVEVSGVAVRSKLVWGYKWGGVGVASEVVWGLQLQQGAHLVFEVAARDVQQV